MAQLFLTELGASVWINGDSEPFDAIAVFHTADGKLRWITVEVKTTEKQVRDDFKFVAKADTIRSLQHSNVPVLFLVMDTKRNEIFFGWAVDIRTTEGREKDRSTVNCTLKVLSTKDGREELLGTIMAQPDSCEHISVGCKR